jgi:hypothetical protein
MKNLSTRWMMIATVLAAGAAANLACSSSSDGNTDAGGGTGGKTDSGSGTGGKMDSGTDVVVNHVVVYNFDTTTEMWSLNTYADPNSRNLAGVYPADGGFDAGPITFDGGAVAAPTLTFDGTIGSPSPGSLKITATFTDCNQYVDAAISGLSPLRDLTGKTLHGQLQVTSGTFSGGAQLHLSTGSNYNAYTSSAFTLGANGTFSSATIDVSHAVPANAAQPIVPTDVIQIGVQIFSGTACTPIAPYPNAGQLVTFNIDTITD